MTVLREVMRHPANARHRARALARWLVHNAARRIRPNAEAHVVIGDVELVGPTDHPVINWATYIEGGMYDLASFLVLIRLLEPGDTFIDVGANIGPYSCLAARRVGPTGTVVAIEPAGDQLTYLRRNLTDADAHVCVCTEPLADRRREVSFESEGPTVGRLTEGKGWITTTLDDVLARCGLLGQGLSSVAKIDVEGWEPAVILGGTAWLETRPKAIIIEAHGFQDRGPVSWDAAATTLLERGYRFAWPVPEGRGIRIFYDPDPVSPYGDYIAVRDDLLGAVGDVLRA